MARAIVAAALLASAAGCEVAFEPNLQPLIIPEAPGQAFVGALDDSQIGIESEVDAAQAGGGVVFGDITSADAIALCQEMEYSGDEVSGSCLAPGGGSYFVWLSPDWVMVVNRSNSYVSAFRAAVENRESSLAKTDDLLGRWPEIALLGLEVLGIGATCGGAVATAATGVGLLVSGLFATGCVAMIAGFGYTAYSIATDAEDLTESVDDVARYERDAAYNFCRMEGKSDAECRN